MAVKRGLGRGLDAMIPDRRAEIEKKQKDIEEAAAKSVTAAGGKNKENLEDKTDDNKKSRIETIKKVKTEKKTEAEKNAEPEIEKAKTIKAETKKEETIKNKAVNGYEATDNNKVMIAEAVKADTVKADKVKTDTGKIKAAKEDASKTEVVKAKAVKAEAAKAEADKTKAVKAEDASKAEADKTKAVKADAAKAQIVKAEEIAAHGAREESETEKEAIPEMIDGVKQDVGTEVAVQKVYDTMQISIHDIDPNRLQPRKNFDEDALMELAESMRQVGVIQPLIVQKEGERYEIIAGERRWRAARLAGLKTVPVVVREYSPQESFEIAMIENLQREDLNPIEEAVAYQRLIQDYGLKQDEAAEKVGKSRVTVTNALRLLKLDERVQQMLIDDMLTGGHARAMLPIEDREEQYALATKVFDEKLSVRETERLVKKLIEDRSKPEGKEEKKAEDSYVYQEIEEYMKRVMGTKVEIKRKANNKGRIEIEYYSNEELERIMDMFRKLER